MAPENFKRAKELCDALNYINKIIDGAHEIERVMSKIAAGAESARLHAREREAGRLSDALNRINMTIASTLDFDKLMRRVVVKAAKAIGSETAVIDLREDGMWTVKYLYGMPPELEGARMTNDQLRHAAIVEKTRQPLVVADAYADKRLNQELVRKHQIRSFLTVPLTLRDQVIGCLSFHYHSAPVPFSEAQVDFATKLGVTLSLALENARLYEAEHRIAATLQESLLKMPTQIPGVDYNCLYRSATAEAAEVGGDFYDLFELERGRVGVVIGDVSGKGLQAATLTSLVKNTIKAYAHKSQTPAEVLEGTNYLLLRDPEESPLVTVFFGLLDTAQGTLEYCNAGHPPPVIKRASGPEFLELGSPAIGMFPDLEFKTARSRLEKDDVLVLFTDGATEARDDIGLFGEEALLLLIQQLSVEAIELPQAIFSHIMDFSRGILTDDIALLALTLANEMQPAKRLNKS